MSTIIRFVRPFVIFAALVAAMLSVTTTSEAREATPAPATFTRLSTPTSDYLSPRGQAVIAKGYTFTEFGQALADSDIFEPGVKGTFTGGSKVTIPGMRFHCQEGERLHWYGVRANGKLVLGQAYNYGRVCLSNYGKAINNTCGPNQDKMFKVLVTVHDGTVGKWATTFRLRLTSGKYLVSRSWTNGTNNQREYYFALKSPTNKVDVSHLGKSTGFISPSLGSYWTAKATKVCQDYDV